VLVLRLPRRRDEASRGGGGLPRPGGGRGGWWPISSATAAGSCNTTGAGGRRPIILRRPGEPCTIGSSEHFELDAAAEVAIEVDPGSPPRRTSRHSPSSASTGCRSACRISTKVSRSSSAATRRPADRVALPAGTRPRIRIDQPRPDLRAPGPGPRGLAATLDEVVRLRPTGWPSTRSPGSRGCVPTSGGWMRRPLPDRATKFALLALLVETLTAAGYRQVGMDHFALPDDELAYGRPRTGPSPATSWATRPSGTPRPSPSGPAGSPTSPAPTPRTTAAGLLLRGGGSGELPVERGYVLDRRRPAPPVRHHRAHVQRAVFAPDVAGASASPSPTCSPES
jgi:hypothetical protein